MAYGTGYPNLHREFGWKPGVRDVRIYGWQHPWVVVFETHTEGCWSREEAREQWREWKDEQETVRARKDCP